MNMNEILKKSGGHITEAQIKQLTKAANDYDKQMKASGKTPTQQLLLFKDTKPGKMDMGKTLHLLDLKNTKDLDQFFNNFENLILVGAGTTGGNLKVKKDVGISEADIRSVKVIKYQPPTDTTTTTAADPAHAAKPKVAPPAAPIMKGAAHGLGIDPGMKAATTSPDDVSSIDIGDIEFVDEAEFAAHFNSLFGAAVEDEAKLSDKELEAKRKKEEAGGLGDTAGSRTKTAAPIVTGVANRTTDLFLRQIDTASTSRKRQRDEREREKDEAAALKKETAIRTQEKNREIGKSETKKIREKKSKVRENIAVVDYNKDIQAGINPRRSKFDPKSGGG